MTQPAGPRTCHSCSAPVIGAMTRCVECGALLHDQRWSSARADARAATNMSLAAHAASEQDRRDARSVVHEAIVDGLTSRADAQRSLWAIEQAGQWRDLESAIAPAIGAPSVPPTGSWVVVTPRRPSDELQIESSDTTVKWIAAAAALILIAVLSGIAFLSDNNDKVPLAQSSSSTSTTSTTVPSGSTAVPPTSTPPSTATPPSSTPPTTAPDPNAPAPPTQPAQSAANLARDSERAKQRLAEVVAVINELVQTIDSSVATLDEQPYPRLPGFYDCYPTETDPLPLPNNQSAANYARAHAEFYSSYAAAIEGELLGTYATLELEDAGFNVGDVDTERDYVSLVVEKDGITIIVEFENPTQNDPLLTSRFMASALDQCTRVD